MKVYASKQVDLKGLPVFVMNLVLKRHPLAIHFVRQQMINPSSARARHPSDSVAEALGSEEERDDVESTSHHFDLPDDFVPDSRNSSSSRVSEEYGCLYEQSMPIEHFTKLS